LRRVRRVRVAEHLESAQRERFVAVSVAEGGGRGRAGRRRGGEEVQVGETRRERGESGGGSERGRWHRREGNERLREVK
jgi:hypothetical protein